MIGLHLHPGSRKASTSFLKCFPATTRRRHFSSLAGSLNCFRSLFAESPMPVTKSAAMATRTSISCVRLPSNFVRMSAKHVECLMDQVQAPVRCYRAPSFSITKATLWALDVLAEEGFKIDSSIFPVRHDLYGIPDANRFPYWIKDIFEFPPTTIRRAKNNFGAAGGGYLRLLPYGFTRWAIRQVNETESQPAMVYFHPWELDPEQPRISAPLRSRIRHYTNLSTMQHKVERLLRDFRFSTISDVCAQLESYQDKHCVRWDTVVSILSHPSSQKKRV